MKSETPLAARAAVRALSASRIREIYNLGVGIPGLLAFWAGEGDEPTPEFIRRAGQASIEAGEVFYSQNLGIPELRDTLAQYVSRIRKRVTPDQIAVTSSGVNALMLASQLLLDPGERAVEVVPLWPNLQEIPRVLGAQTVTVPLRFEREWKLDLDELLDALTPGTRAVYVNSPNNPTGWTISREDQQAILAHCRRHGIWIVADDAYERLYYGEGGLAPSFLDISEPEDRVIGANTFSKSWLMTGWRLGWLVVPPGVAADLAKLIEYNTSCAPVFVQRAGIAAVKEGEPVIAHSRARFRRARDSLVKELETIEGIDVSPPPGAMYLFFCVRGMTDSLAFCKQLLRKTALGLAPGSAFGPEGEGFVRWCFASSEARLAEGAARLRKFLA
ncbi:MAG: pyridoxal phosphate-dependent aminotransferase [Betaproteobacteria bacterium]